MAFYAHKREGPDGEPIRQTVYMQFLCSPMTAAMTAAKA